MAGKSRIYTGGGDEGMTSLAGGIRVPKTHPRLEAYGTIDELNAFIGLLVAEVDDVDTQELLLFIQSQLFFASSYLAADPTKTDDIMECRITDDCIKKIENAIDLIDNELPKLKAFVVTGGSRTAALAHVCRTVCRRAERMICHLAETENVEAPVLVFMNRLSDLLFVIARKECLSKKGEEKFWNYSCT